MLTRSNLLKPTLTLVFAALVAGCAGAPQTAQRTTDAPNDIRVAEWRLSDIATPELPDPELPDIQRIELDNGLIVFLVEDRSLPIVRASARLAGGSLWEPADKVGLASITGSVMRSGGTETLSSDELNQFLEDRGASIEVGIGQDGGTASMSALTEYAPEVLRIFRDVLARPAFSEQQVTIARTQARTGIARRNDNPQGIANREFQRALYGADNPYARIEEYYTIDAIGRDDLVQFHNRFIHPNTTLLAVWGDFDSNEMEAQLRNVFGTWQADPSATRPAPPPREAERRREIHFIQKGDVTQSTVLIGHPGEITLDHPDYFAVLVMNEVLGGGFSGRLFRTVRSDLGLAYSVFGQYGAGYRVPGLFFSGTFTRSESTVEAARAMLTVLEGMRAAPPTQQEVNDAKESYLNSFVFNFATRAQVLGRALTYTYHGYPEDFLLRIKEGVEAVTPQDVYRVAQRYLHPDEAMILIVGNAPDFSEPVSALGPYSEIDITIPTTPPGAQVEYPTGPVHSGPEENVVLDRVMNFLGGRATFRDIAALRLENVTTVSSPAGEIQLTGRSTLVPPARAYVEQTTPMGSFTIVLDGERAMVRTPQGEQQVPSAQAAPMRESLYQEIAFLMNLVATERATTRVLDQADGLDVIAITPPGGAQPIRLYADPATGRPVRLVFSMMTPQGPMPSVITYDDYRRVNGFMLPFLAVTSREGQDVGRTVYSVIEILSEVPSGLFD